MLYFLLRLVGAIEYAPKYRHNWIVVGAAGGPAMMDCTTCPATNYSTY